MKLSSDEQLHKRQETDQLMMTSQRLPAPTRYKPPQSPTHTQYKKAQLSLTNPRDAKICQKLLQFDVLNNVVADNTGLSSFV